MRGDKQWFDDVIAECELSAKLENIMFGMGMSVYRDPALLGWFKFHSCQRFADKPVWEHETFKDYGGYQAYIDDYEPPQTYAQRTMVITAEDPDFA